MNEDLSPPASATWDSKRRRHRRWNTAAGAFTLALFSVSGLYWVKNPPVNLGSAINPQATHASSIDR